MSIPIQDVLVVHPNAVRRAALASALALYRVVAVESKLEATFRLAHADPALIIAPADGARHFLREVAHSAPNALRVFICSQQDSVALEELVQSAAEGHVFSVLDEALSGPELGRTLSHLLQHRGSALMVLASESYRVHFRAAGVELEARCHEVGNFGATVLLPGEHSAAAFPPGMALAQLRIENAERVLLSLPCTYVQRARPVQSEQGPALRLELSWTHAMHPPPLVPGVVMEQQSEIVATLRKALRREAPMWVQRTEDASVQLRLEKPVVELVDGVATLYGQSSGSLEALAGDEVDLFFEMGGQSYAGASHLLLDEAAGQLALRVPSTLTIRNWRALPRFKPSAEDRFLISFQSPFSGQHSTRAVLDLSMGGLSFPFDATGEIIPAGSRFEASLLLPDGTSSRCEFEVRSVHAVPSDGQVGVGLRPFRAGARLTGLSEAAQAVILRAFMTSRCAAIADGADVSFTELWQLMEAARYRFHPDYPFGDLPPPAVLEETHHKVYSTGCLGRSLVYSNSRGLQGQVAALRIHSRTWLVQHLVVRPGVRRNEQISYDLSNLIVELGELQRDVEFIRYSWRKDNRWPSRRMGWLARAMETPGLSLLRHFNYLRLPLSAEPPTAPGGLPRVREAGRADFVWLEQHLRSLGAQVRVLSENLLADEAAELGGLSERFRAHGLHRRRRAFVVEGEQGPLAMALSEEGTPGLNLIEKTNSFGLVVPQRDHPRAREAVQALMQRCVEHARERGMPSAIALVDDEDIEPLQAAGFENLGRFSEWIVHRSMLRRCYELWRSVFERLGGEPVPDWTTEEAEE